MRTRAFEHLGNTRALFSQRLQRQGFVFVIGQAQGVTRTGQGHRPHTGAATFEDTWPGVVNLHAGRDVVDTQGDDVSQRLCGMRTAIRYFVGSYHMICDVAVLTGQIDHFLHDHCGITGARTDFQAFATQSGDGFQSTWNQS
ncbi:hypothetical protein D9M71_565300 [compost metagenome]